MEQDDDIRTIYTPILERVPLNITSDIKIIFKNGKEITLTPVSEDKKSCYFESLIGE